MFRRLLSRWKKTPGREPGVVLFEYATYEEYRDTQVPHNRRKLDRVWADERTLSAVADRVRREFPEGPLYGLCHGSRNGFEQAFLRERLGAEVIGTDISDTATSFLHSVH
jgi:hypothetical protein